jgi:hypothetical protein
MISRSGVCGLNFTQRSSFSTHGLRQRMSSKPIPRQRRRLHERQFLLPGT